MKKSDELDERGIKKELTELQKDRLYLVYKLLIEAGQKRKAAQQAACSRPANAADGEGGSPTAQNSIDTINAKPPAG